MESLDEAKVPILEEAKANLSIFYYFCNKFLYI